MENVVKRITYMFLDIKLMIACLTTICLKIVWSMMIKVFNVNNVRMDMI